MPVGLIFYRTFEHGLSAPIDAITSSDGLHAFWLTIVCVGIAVPLNTIFGVITALVLVRQDFRGKSLVNAVIDVPFAISRWSSAWRCSWSTPLATAGSAVG